MGRTRSFIGVDIGDGTRTAAAALQQALAKTGADVNWTPAANFHVTLLFLGEVDDRDIPAVCRVVATAAAAEPAFALRVRGVGAFPTPRRPKVVWGGIEDGTDELRRLYAAMEQPLLDLGCYRREFRDYTAHLTLGRVTSEADGQRLAPELPKYAAWEGGTSQVAEVILFGSILTREGPEYTVLGRAPLGG